MAVFASLALALLFVLAGGGGRYLAEQNGLWLGLLLGGGTLFATGMVDDLRGLRPSTKLVLQSIAAIFAFAYGCRVEVLGIGPSTEIALGWLSLPITVLWIVGVTNAFNLIDGMDGLATGIALVALGTVTAVAAALGNWPVLVACVALAGSLLGFLRYNFNPARIFLGDSGSLFIGFMLAVLAVYGSMKSATAVLVVVPVFALALPLLDTGLAIARRWLRGAPLSGADARHIHHRLIALGLTHRHAVLILYSVASALAMLGLFVALAPPTAVVAIATVGGTISLGLILLGMRRLDYHEFSELGAVLAAAPLRARWVIRDQIHARDIAKLIEHSKSLEAVRAVLEDTAPAFGFLHMELCRETAPRHVRVSLSESEKMMRAWKLEYPVTPRCPVEDDSFVLRIWCAAGLGSRPYGAERVARILAPTVEAWMARMQGEGLEIEGAVEVPVRRPLQLQVVSQ